MKNKKVIVINGFGRGGTNLLWNIMQSHPFVCSPIYETGQVLFHLRPPKEGKIPYFSSLLRNETWSLKPRLFSLISWLVDAKLYKYKQKTFGNSHNRFKSEGIPYSKVEVNTSVLCVKSIVQDIYINDLFAQMYNDCFFLAIVRNGYALCEGWMRRKSFSPSQSGRLYREIGEAIITYSQKYKRYKIIKFEDMVADPFDMASKLYQFAQLNPTTTEKLRFKTKRVMSKAGEHKPVFGQENNKYWFSPETIHEIIVPDISNTQAGSLSVSDKKIFEKEAMPVLEHFGYI